MAPKEIERATMFKLPGPEAVPKIVELYKIMAPKNKKNGKPYILSLKVGPTNTDDPRHNGYGFVAFSRFASMEDMKYYDDEDEAHQELKASLKPIIVGGVMSVYTEDLLGA